MIARRCLALLFTIALGLPFATAIGAHEPGNSAVLIDVTENVADAHLQLPLEPLSVALDMELLSMTVISDHEDLLLQYIEQHVSATGSDGQAWSHTVGPLGIETIDAAEYLTASVRFTPPNGEVTDFTLHYDVILEEVVSHDILVTASVDGGDAALVATLDYQSAEVLIATHSGTTTNRGFIDMVSFGFEHVLEGADHLLFLIVLLLPAPAIIGPNKRWSRRGEAIPSLKRVVGVASAFTVGHALTIALSAKGGFVVPSGPVEVLVALSVLAGAVHAWRPIARHGEVAIAASFGLVHGLAFAGLLEQLGLGTTSWTTLAAFNIGVELAQLVTITLTFPVIYLISCTPRYDLIRMTLAAVAGMVAIGWAVERIGLARSPFNAIEDAVIERPLVVIAAFAALAVGLRFGRIPAARGTSAHTSSRGAWLQRNTCVPHQPDSSR